MDVWMLPYHNTVLADGKQNIRGHVNIVKTKEVVTDLQARGGTRPS